MYEPKFLSEAFTAERSFIDTLCQPHLMAYIRSSRKDRHDQFSPLTDEDFLYMCFKHFESGCSDEDLNTISTFLHQKYKKLGPAFDFKNCS